MDINQYRILQLEEKVKQLERRIALLPQYNILMTDSCDVRKDCKNCRQDFSKNITGVNNYHIISCKNVDIKEKCKNCIAIGDQNLFIDLRTPLYR